MRRSLLVLSLLVMFGTAQADGIAWIEGDVAAALDLAKNEQKPIFLYWGAVWCPPCNQIKKTIFTQREFIEKSKLFIPVYLDGDTESAQVWGEKLDIWGYPSMLVLSPEGQEVMRLPTGLQVEAFSRALDEALQRLTPIETVLDEALASRDGVEVPDDDYRLLAYYSWGQNRQLGMTPREEEAKFRQLAEQVPERLATERSRLYLLWLGSAESLTADEAEKGRKGFKLSKKQRAAAAQRLQEILASEELTIANLQSLAHYASELIRLVYPKPGKGRRALSERWLTTMERVEQRASLSIDERLSALNPAVDIHHLQEGEDAPFNEALLDRVRARVAWTDEAADDHYTRQATISNAGYLLRRVGLDDEARQLYLAEVERSETPWYFMSSLSSMAREDDEPERAVNWLAQAYDSSKGRATRFQWGTSYLMGMMDLIPDEAERIQTESIRVLKEMLDFDDAFAGRNALRISWLADSFVEWNSEQAHAEKIASVRSELLPVCEGLSGAILEPGEDEPESLQSRCTEFFTGLGQG